MKPHFAHATLVGALRAVAPRLATGVVATVAGGVGAFDSGGCAAAMTDISAGPAEVEGGAAAASAGGVDAAASGSSARRQLPQNESPDSFMKPQLGHGSSRGFERSIDQRR